MEQSAAVTVASGMTSGQRQRVVLSRTVRRPKESFGCAPEEVCERFQNSGDAGEKSAIKVYQVEKPLELPQVSGGWEAINSLHMAGERDNTTLSLTICPKNLTEEAAKVHLEGLMVSPFSFKISKNVCKCSRCSSMVALE